MFDNELNDWEELLRDSDFSSELSDKMQDMLTEIQNLADDKLMGFTQQELSVMKGMYGDKLTYALHKDIEFALSCAPLSETIH
jgi:hypothetical protein